MKQLIKQMMAAVMAFSLVVCCCHAHSLSAGLAGGLNGDMTGMDDAVAARSSCCPSPASPDGTPCDDDSKMPQKGCQSCCIKGSGQEDAGPQIDALVATALPFLDLPVRIAPVAMPERDGRFDVPVTPPHVAPRTLVRLHCALIV